MKTIKVIVCFSWNSFWHIYSTLFYQFNWFLTFHFRWRILMSRTFRIRWPRSKWKLKITAHLPPFWTISSGQRTSAWWFTTVNNGFILNAWFSEQKKGRTTAFGRFQGRRLFCAILEIHKIELLFFHGFDFDKKKMFVEKSPSADACSDFVWWHRTTLVRIMVAGITSEISWFLWNRSVHDIIYLEVFRSEPEQKKIT